MIDTGVGIQNPFFFIGVVENNLDYRKEGRVQVRAFGVHGRNSEKEVPTRDLPWAVCASGSYDPNTPPPPLNSFVYGMFLDGREAQHPLILGLIPTQFTEPNNPEVSGWGVIPEKEGDKLAKGSGPNDIGQPQQSRLMRGEGVEETYVLDQELNLCENMKIGGTDETWSEPSCAYGAEYPYNRVIETAHHSIELDDTPGGERITIRHKEGSYIQIDSLGNVAEKSVGSKHDVACGNKYEYAEANHIVTIGGNAHVYVKGNKTEEIEGDYNLLVHGSAQFGVGGQMSLNASDQLQARGADVKIQANVGTMAVHAEDEIQIEAGKQLNLKSQNLFNYATRDYQVFSNLSMKFTALYNQHFVSSNSFFDCNGLFPAANGTGFNVRSTTGIFADATVGPVSIKSNTLMTLQSTAGNISIKAPLVAVDDVISLGTGIALPAVPAGTPSLALPTIGAAKPQIPEPPSKSTSIVYKGYGSGGAGGYTSSDDSID